MKKFLIIRFSSIGDIVLTTPVTRCLRAQYPDATIHYLTKATFASILERNPAVDKVYTIEKEITECIGALKAENYDFLIDLHHNLRTFRLKKRLKQASGTFDKLNLQKFLLTKFKVNRMPDIHIVDRYFKAVETLGVVNDDQGLDYFLTEEDTIDFEKSEDLAYPKEYIAFAIGAQFATKRMEAKTIIELIHKIKKPVVLLGGPTDAEAGKLIAASTTLTTNLCGKLSLHQSAYVLKGAEKVISHDTGLMHIAAAFKKPIISIWGNTVPEFGMYPYLPKKPELYTIAQVDVACRPCSKIGHQSCPNNHFKCMREQDLTQIANQANAVT